MTARVWILLAAVLCLSAPLLAQDGLRSASLPERSLGTPPPNSPPDLYRAGPTTYAPRFDRVRPPRTRGYGGGVYGPWGPWAGSDDAALRGEPRPGFLQVLADPAAAQVYVDGLYVAVVDDLRRTVPGRALDPGPHRVELRADGYQPFVREIRIDPGETTLLRADLSPVAAPPAPAIASAPAPRRTFYVIPGCYAGDRPPRQDHLPPGCRVADVRRQ